MNRNEVTEKIITAKVAKGIQWADVATKVGLSKEWTTAGCLGQMTFDAPQAAVIGEIFGLTDEEQKWLQVVPYKGSLPTPVPTDPLIYRWYEIVSVYGTTIKELIHEEFGDGIMSAIDKKPSQLSGGMKQRVGIARAFAIQPHMLLLDEPFGALDALTRGTIQDELIGIVRQTQQTVFMITHDVDEAILLADRILLMRNGADTPAGYQPGSVAATVVNPLPRERTRAGLHHLAGYYPLRNQIVDFLIGID